MRRGWPGRRFVPRGEGEEETMTKKILIADDEQNIVISLEFLMKREGFAVCIANDGQEALDKVRSESPDLVLLDVMMPHKNGYEVCQEIRADAGLQGTRILMLTAATEVNQNALNQLANFLVFVGKNAAGLLGNVYLGAKSRHKLGDLDAILTSANNKQAFWWAKRL